MNTFVVVTFSLLFVLMLITAGVGIKLGDSRRKKKVAAILQSTSLEMPAAEASLLKDRAELAGAWATSILSHLNMGRAIQSRIQQAGMTLSMEKFLLSSLGLGVAGSAVGFHLHIMIAPELSALLLGFALALLPYLFISFKRGRRQRAFEEQLPEALDFLSRALRAGHAFSVSLELLADEFPDPLGMEFRKVFNEQNLGSPMEAALRNLAARIPMVDVNFFVSAVLLQRETGGNLSEILNKLSAVIRERFKLKGHVKATSASARMTGTVLTVLPIVLAALLNLVNPGYLEGMVNDPTGQKMIIAAIVAQFIGYLVIRKIVNITV